jgi:hypothetical protein
MIDPKSMVIGGVAVLILGAGTWTVSRIDTNTDAIVEQTTLVVASQTPVATPFVTAAPTDAPVAARLTVSGVAKADGVHLSWKAYTGSDFEYGKVVRSESNPNLRYPDDGYIHYYSEQSLASYTDTKAVNGTSYYYRICAKQKGGEVVCGNVIRVKATTASATPKPAAKEGFTPVTGKLALTATKGSDSVALAWTAWPNAEGFNYYKVVRSQSNANPYYPNDGYITYITDRGTLSYTDDEPKEGTSYYRICAVSDAVYCGNVVTITR